MAQNEAMGRILRCLYVVLASAVSVALETGDTSSASLNAVGCGDGVAVALVRDELRLAHANLFDKITEEIRASRRFVVYEAGTGASKHDAVGGVLEGASRADDGGPSRPREDFSAARCTATMDEIRKVEKRLSDRIETLDAGVKVLFYVLAMTLCYKLFIVVTADPLWASLACVVVSVQLLPRKT
jgi:hypothetical protein